MCLPKLHVNLRRPQQSDFAPEVMTYLRRMLAPDMEIHRCAQAIHAAQTSQHRANFTDALTLFKSDEFQEKLCPSIHAKHKERLKQLHKKNPMMRLFTRGGSCFYHSKRT